MPDFEFDSFTGFSDDIVPNKIPSNEQITNALNLNRNLQMELVKRLNLLNIAQKKNKNLLRSFNRQIAYESQYLNPLKVTVHCKPPYFVDAMKDSPPENQDTINHPINQSRMKLIKSFSKWNPSQKKTLETEVVRENKRLAVLTGNTLSDSDPFLLSNIEGLDWESISSHIDHHSAIDCKIQWTNNQHPIINDSPFSKCEVAKLSRLCKKYENRNWVQIATEMGNGRVAHQCFKVYGTQLDQSNYHKEWTFEEDLKLKKAVEIYGVDSNWLEISYFLEGRTTIQCQNRYTKALFPGLKKGKWSPDEDAKLLEGVEMYGVGKWTKISEHIETRTDSQCRERYENCLRPGLKTSRFTEEERERLIELISEHGEGNWSLIASLFDNERTDNQLWREWKKISKERSQIKNKSSTTLNENPNDASTLHSDPFSISNDPLNTPNLSADELMVNENIEIENIKAFKQQLKRKKREPKKQVKKISKNLSFEPDSTTPTVNPIPPNIATCNALITLLNQLEEDEEGEEENLPDPTENMNLEEKKSFDLLSNQIGALFGPTLICANLFELEKTNCAKKKTGEE